VRTFIIGSRGSELALRQANQIKTALKTAAGAEVEIKIIKTKGDVVEDVPLGKIEGKGFFTRELEESLLEGNVDIAVHSLKDLMTTLPPGLKLGAVGYRADRRELLLTRKETYQRGTLLPVRAGGTVGTGAARRRCQVAWRHPALKAKEIRGNVPTRISKLRQGEYDAILVAAAGVTRLEMDLSDLMAVYLDPALFLPAPGQGVLALEIRTDDAEAERTVKLLDSPSVRQEVALERGLLGRFDEGCSLPLGVMARVVNQKHHLKAILGVPDGDGWAEPKQCDITGNESAAVVKKAYQVLSGEDPA
jgi:hydroxymethylbilane synthase